MSKKLIRSTVNPLELPVLFFAGNSRLTFRNQDAGTHITVHVKQLKHKTQKDEKGQRLRLPIYYLKISLLGDHDHGYVFAGTIFKETMTFKAPQYGFRWDSQLGKVTAFVMTAVKHPEILRKKNVALFHEGSCCRCGLPLTHPQSISRGLGDDCWEYTREAREKALAESESPL